MAAGNWGAPGLGPRRCQEHLMFPSLRNRLSDWRSLAEASPTARTGALVRAVFHHESRVAFLWRPAPLKHTSDSSSDTPGRLCRPTMVLDAQAPRPLHPARPSARAQPVFHHFLAEQECTMCFATPQGQLHRPTEDLDARAEQPAWPSASSRLPVPLAGLQPLDSPTRYWADTQKLLACTMLALHALPKCSSALCKVIYAQFPCVCSLV